MDRKELRSEFDNSYTGLLTYDRWLENKVIKLQDNIAIEAEDCCGNVKQEMVNKIKKLEEEMKCH